MLCETHEVLSCVHVSMVTYPYFKIVILLHFICSVTLPDYALYPNYHIILH